MKFVALLAIQFAMSSVIEPPMTMPLKSSISGNKLAFLTDKTAYFSSTKSLTYWQ